MNNEASQPTCPSPKLRITLNPFLVTMLQAVAHAIHFKRILNFGEGQAIHGAFVDEIEQLESSAFLR